MCAKAMLNTAGSLLLSISIVANSAMLMVVTIYAEYRRVLGCV